MLICGDSSSQLSVASHTQQGFMLQLQGICFAKGMLMRAWIPKVRVLAWRREGLWFCSVSGLFVTEIEEQHRAMHISCNKYLSHNMVWQFSLLFSVVYFHSVFVVLNLYLFHGLEFLWHFGFLPYSCLLVLIPHQSAVFFEFVFFFEVIF